jgi:hypothetical protein
MEHRYAASALLLRKNETECDATSIRFLRNLAASSEIDMIK